jgi:SAM-dependent methyltransferase
MKLTRVLPRRYFAAALLSASLLVAQNSKPARDPDVPYVPTTEPAVEEMLKLAKVTKSDIVYDLGCGDGRIVIAAAKKYGARGVGIDINPVRISEARANAKKAGVEHLVRFEENDLFKADIHDATVVSLFLLPTSPEAVAGPEARYPRGLQYLRYGGLETGTGSAAQRFR